MNPVAAGSRNHDHKITQPRVYPIDYLCTMLLLPYIFLIRFLIPSRQFPIFRRLMRGLVGIEDDALLRPALRPALRLAGRNSAANSAANKPRQNKIHAVWFIRATL